jgi:prepilin peptidase CpaA
VRLNPVIHHVGVLSERLAIRCKYMNYWVIALLMVSLASASVYDLRTRRIPNWLTFPGTLAGLSLNWWVGGYDGLLASFFGLSTGFFLLFFFYLLGGMGGGDVKLLALVGSFLGPRLAFYAFVWMALSGGILAVGSLIYKRAFSQTARNLKSLLLGWILRTGQSANQVHLQNPSLIKLPYGVAIATGTVLAVYFQGLPGIILQGGSIHFTWF